MIGQSALPAGKQRGSDREEFPVIPHAYHSIQKLATNIDLYNTGKHRKTSAMLAPLLRVNNGIVEVNGSIPFGSTN